MDLQIRGAEQLGDLAKQLRAAGESGKGLRKELYAGLNRATKPLRETAQKRAAADLPQEGGLAALVSKKKGSTRIRTGKNPSVTITYGGSGASTDRGFIRHRVFGRGPWVNQPVEGAGWFTNTMRGGGPTVRKELTEAIENVAEQIRKA